MANQRSTPRLTNQRIDCERRDGVAGMHHGRIALLHLSGRKKLKVVFKRAVEDNVDSGRQTSKWEDRRIDG